MAILIHDYYELEERAGKHLRAWKVWHIIIYACAAIFGALNYVFLHNTMYMVDDNCVFKAPQIVLETILVYHPANVTDEAKSANETDATIEAQKVNDVNGNGVEKRTNETELKNEAQTTAVPPTTAASGKSKREVGASTVTDAVDNITSINNGSTEEREVLDLIKTYFGPRQDCEFAEYMPIMSTIFGLLWTTLFVMCPGGGRSRSGLSQPWRILAPALIFALVLVGLTGSSFTQTNRGLREFCAGFYNYTNATTCSSVNVYLERSWNASWKFSGRAEATRAASAGVWASWACAATLLIVRCLAAPDFELVKTGVYLAKDPAQKVTPYLLKSRRRGQSPSPNKSVRSEPTATTELVASVSVEKDSAPTSRLATPEPRFDTDHADYIIGFENVTSV